MYHIIFYQDGKCEEYEGKFTNYPCSPDSIKMIVEYNNGQIINYFNPNDIWWNSYFIEINLRFYSMFVLL